MRHLLPLTLLLTLPSQAEGPLWPDLSEPPQEGGGSNDAAVIVAIEDYVFVPDIAGAQSNGLDWYAYLTDGRGISPSRVKLLENHQATKEEIEQAVADARGEVRPGGTLWFVFIGHGAPSADGMDGVLLGVDTQQTAKSVYARGLPQSSLLSSLSGGAQEQTVVLLDACFSGQRQGGALVAGLQPLIPTFALSSGQTTVLSAGKGDEFAGPLPGLDRPAFSYLALGALRGWGDEDGDGSVSASEVAAYAEGALSALPLGRSQTPQHTGPDGTLGRGREAGPSLSSIRRALSSGGAASTPTDSLTVESSGGGGVDVEAYLTRQREAETLTTAQAELRRQREEALSSAVSSQRAEASSEWARMSPLLETGGEIAAEAVSAYVSAWSDAEVSVTDAEGRHVRAVEAPEVSKAEAWLSSQSQSQSPSSSPSPSGGAAAGETRTGSSGYELAWIPEGRFTMGSPLSEEGRDDDESQHEVQLTRGFWMGTTEVTQGLWQSVMGSNPSYFSSCGLSCPVESVSWYDAAAFANALSVREGLEACYVISYANLSVSWPRGFECEGYRLPTEAEWEYAARAGEGFTYAGSDEPDSVAWTLGNSRGQTHPVGQKGSNAWGLYDMSGNVWEWVWERTGDYSGGSVVDPVGPGTGSARVIRGGSWYYQPSVARLANRGSDAPSSQGSGIGVRLVRR